MGEEVIYMFKSLVEMKSAMCAILIYVRDNKFEHSVIREEFGEIEADESIYACVAKGLISGVNTFRSESKYPLVLTYVILKLLMLDLSLSNL